MESLQITTLCVICFNVAFSYFGFKSNFLFDKYKFEVDSILTQKQYLRLFTSGFLHVGWLHLILNMVSLYAFGDVVLIMTGPVKFCIIYLAGLLGGNFLALYFHRHHGDYSAVGASGAVSGIVFSALILIPGTTITVFQGSLEIPGWLYAIGYILITIYGVRSQRGNVGHEAHLGGALTGMLVALGFVPAAFGESYLLILSVLIPSLAFLFVIIKQPHVLWIERRSGSNDGRYHNIDDRYNHNRWMQQNEIDQLLDKISRDGLNSLSQRERKRLDELSDKKNN